MAYGYLLAPSFQFVNINGRPLVGGHIEVFIHNTDTKYITKADFDGTDNPFKVQMNSKGMAVIIASGDFTYDVFCYDRFGSLFWSGSDVAIDNSSGLVIEGAELPMRIVGGKITNNGKELTCTGENAWAEGAETTASGANAHAEGGLTTASGEHSHSEGFKTTASSGYSHAEGAGSKATNSASHAEGQDTTASGQASHAEGRGSEASGNYSHASGRGTRATNEGSHAVGRWNDDGDAFFVVGDGTNNNQRHDAFKVDRNGDTWVSINGVLTKVTNVSGCGQFILVRSNMTTDFTNDEYQDCVDAVTNGKAVCCQFVQTGTTIQAQLTMITGGGTLVFEFTAENNHYRWEVNATNNAHSIELIGNIFGVPIFDTLQDAIASEYTLKSGDIFETNGFHTSGDGGAARYRVSSTGTANGMDIVQLAAGKLAMLQVTQECSPEKIGYVNGTDAVPYIDRLIAIGIKRIRLIKSYTWKTTLTLTTKAIDFVGNSPFTQSPVTSLINVNLNAGLTSAIVLRAPNITFENLFFYNAKDTPSNETAVECDWTSNANNYMIKFKRVRFVSFNYGVYFHGTLPWHITFEDVVLGWCNYGIVFAGNSSILSFKNVHTNGCYVCGINMRGATQGVTFTQCNFGSYSNALHFEKYGLGMNQEYTFNGCNFELDKLDLDGNTKNVFIDVDNDINVSLDFSGCNFVITKQEMQVIPANMRFIRLGNGSTLRMTACIIEDDLSGNAYLKQFIDESRPPLQETGSLSIDSTTRFFEVNNALIPYVMRTGQAKGLVADGARTGSEVAISDCNTWIPDYDGQVKVGRVSTYESTQNMPVPSSFYGFLWTMGVIHNPNIRIWQMLLGNNGNIYTRLGMDLGGGMSWGAWKTITAS